MSDHLYLNLASSVSVYEVIWQEPTEDYSDRQRLLGLHKSRMADLRLIAEAEQLFVTVLHSDEIVCSSDTAERIKHKHPKIEDVVLAEY